MNKKILFIVIALVIILGGLAGYSYWKKISEGRTPEVLGEAQIVVYARGEKIALDPTLPYFEELQLACEEMLELRGFGETFTTPYGFGSLIENKSALSALGILKSKEWAVELIFMRPQELYLRVGHGVRKTPFIFSRFLIPLTGELIHISYQDKTYTSLFIFPEKIDDPHLGSLGKTTKDVQKIKEILKEKFYIEVP